MWGGVVEKFVGDAVVGVFGVPTTHEDDPERAVMTAIRLLERLPELPRLSGRRLEARVGINTGAAVVRLDVAPGSGEGFLVGDAVNTAARLQKLAPPMGIVVGEKTRELTSRSIVYERLEPAAVKGKRGAVRHWLVRGSASRMGVDLRQEFPAPLVDREVELGILKGLLKKVRASSQPRFAIVVGEAGIGKSRLLFEFLRYIDSRPAIVRWRQGRCPAYGDGLTFWPVGEIVREQLGVSDSDDVMAIEAKLARALAGQADREWLAARLRPLLSLKSPAASRDENFAAWRRFIELVAADSPAVVVFEDLHWASEATLAFLGHLLAELRGAPLLVLGTARAELFSARADLGQRLSEAVGSGRIVRVDLEPLTELETQTMIDGVGHRLGGLAETRQAIARRSAGNPLYVEQLVHLLEEESPAGGGAADLVLKEKAAEALPESLQSLIAARLDELPPECKTQLADAAVVGEVFWTGAVAALDHGDRQAAAGGLEELRRRDLVQSRRDSSIVGECEFTFSHALIRDVAYGQLSRAARAVKHAAVARWVETEVGDHPGDVAEIIAHHYATALELAGLAGDGALVDELLAPTVRALELAGESALPLDVAAAERYFGRAVALAPSGMASRPSLLVAWAEALAQGGDLSHAARLLDEGIDALRRAGDIRSAAVAMTRLRDVLWELNDPRSDSLAPAALELLADDEPSREKVRVMADVAVHYAVNYKGRAAVAAADEALALCSSLGLPESGRALGWRGMARCDLGDAGGLEDMRRALRLMEGQGLWREAGVMFYVLAAVTADYEGPRAALTVHRRGLQFASRRGDAVAVGFLRSSMLETLAAAGEWSQGLRLSDEAEPVLERRGEVGDLATLRTWRAWILAMRGALDEADPLIAWSMGQHLLEPGTMVPILSVLGSIQLASGAPEAALRTLAEVDVVQRRLDSHPRFSLSLPIAVRTAVAAGDPGLAGRLVEGASDDRAVDANTIAALQAALAESRGDHEAAAAAFADAAARWRSFGASYEWAQTQLGQGRCLLALGRASEAAQALGAARTVFKRLKAKPALAEADA